MIEQDYIMRLIREFMSALQRFLEKKESGQQEEDLRDLYRQYVGDYVFFHTATLDEVMEAMEDFAADQRLSRMEMLAELYYVESSMRSKPVADMLLQKSLALFRFVDRHSTTFSIDRRRKILGIEQVLQGDH